MAQYTTMEELQELVRQLNTAATQETDNYNALCVQCQDLIAKIEEHAGVTNKYGEWFASMYRDMLSNVPGEKNTELTVSQTINAVIDFIEGGFDQMSEAKENELKLGISDLQAQIDSKRNELENVEHQLSDKMSDLQKLQWELEECKNKLKQAQIDACYAKDELDNDVKVLRSVQENICYTQLENQPNGDGHKAPKKSSASPKVTSTSSTPSDVQPQQTPHAQPSIKQYTSSRHILDTSNMGKNFVNGFTTPNAPESGHLYLCDNNGFIDITRLPEVRRNNLMMLNADIYQFTGKPQFKLELEGRKFYIIEQQQTTNLIDGHPLQGRNEIKNGCEIIITDLKGQSFKLCFILG